MHALTAHRHTSLQAVRPHGIRHCWGRLPALPYQFSAPYCTVRPAYMAAPQLACYTATLEAKQGALIRRNGTGRGEVVLPTISQS